MKGNGIMSKDYINANIVCYNKIRIKEKKV